MMSFFLANRTPPSPGLTPTDGIQIHLQVKTIEMSALSCTGWNLDRKHGQDTLHRYDNLFDKDVVDWRHLCQQNFS